MQQPLQLCRNHLRQHLVSSIFLWIFGTWIVRMFFFASSLSVFKLIVLSDTQLGSPQELRLPSTCSKTSLTAVSKDPYLSVMSTVSSNMLRARNLSESSSWNYCLVSESCSFFQLNLGLMHGFPLLVLNLVTRQMLTMRCNTMYLLPMYSYGSLLSIDTKVTINHLRMTSVTMTS